MLMAFGGFLCFGRLESDGVDEWVIEALWGFRGQKCFRPFTFLLDQSSSACLPWPTSEPEDCPMSILSTTWLVYFFASERTAAAVSKCAMVTIS
jgi:hypothetical protein